MSDFTDYSESSIVNWIVGGTNMPAALDPVYIALHTNDPTNSGEDNEVTAASYSRVATQASTDWDILGNTFSNDVEIKFPEAEENWGNVSHFSLWDSETGGNAVASSELSKARDVDAGDAPVFRIDTLNGSVN